MSYAVLSSDLLRSAAWRGLSPRTTEIAVRLLAELPTNGSVWRLRLERLGLCARRNVRRLIEAGIVSGEHEGGGTWALRREVWTMGGWRFRVELDVLDHLVAGGIGALRVYLHHLRNQGSKAWSQSVRQICAGVSLCRRTVEGAHRYLRDLGLLRSSERTTESGWRLANVWRILTPRTAPKRVKAEAPKRVKAEQPEAVNRVMVAFLVGYYRQQPVSWWDAVENPAHGYHQAVWAHYKGDAASATGGRRYRDYPVALAEARRRVLGCVT